MACKNTWSNGKGGSFFVSTDNSTETLLTDTSVFTGEWEDVSNYASVVVAVKTDQNGTFSVQFSPDGVNQDSTLTRQYRTSQIEAPHRFTVTRKYCRVVFTNNSGSDQTYLRLQTSFGSYPELNAPTDSTLAQDFDATVVRPTDFKEEVALGLRQGTTLWNKFGYNADIDSGTPELVSSIGGAMAIHTTASTFDLVSDSANDDDGGTGCNSVVVYGVDSNWDTAIEVVTLDGLTPVTTTTSWIGHPNRIAMFLCGSGQVNAGTITCTRTTGGASVANMPVGEGVTQSSVFVVAEDHQFLAEWMLLGVARQASQNPKVTFKFWVYSAVNNGKQEVLRKTVNSGVDVSVELNPSLSFPIGEKSIVWIEAESDKNDTEVTVRYSGILHRNSDA